MSLANSLAATLGALLTGLAPDLGCTVAIYRPVVTSGADGSPARTYVLDPAWASVPAFFATGSTSQSQSTDTVSRPHGVRTTASGTFTFPQDSDGVLPTISPFDGFKILSGPFAGYTWISEADHVPDAIGATAKVRVVSAPAGVIP